MFYVCPPVRKSLIPREKMPQPPPLFLACLLVRATGGDAYCEVRRRKEELGSARRALILASGHRQDAYATLNATSRHVIGILPVASYEPVAKWAILSCSCSCSSSCSRSDRACISVLLNTAENEKRQGLQRACDVLGCLRG